jgi:hypothetical protein
VPDVAITDVILRLAERRRMGTVIPDYDCLKNVSVAGILIVQRGAEGPWEVMDS